MHHRSTCLISEKKPSLQNKNEYGLTGSLCCKSQVGQISPTIVTMYTNWTSHSGYAMSDQIIPSIQKFQLFHSFNNISPLDPQLLISNFKEIRPNLHLDLLMKCIVSKAIMESSVICQRGTKALCVSSIKTGSNILSLL